MRSRARSIFPHFALSGSFAYPRRVPLESRRLALDAAGDADDPQELLGRVVRAGVVIAGVARVGDGNWKLYHARLFLRQSFGLGGEPESIAAETHQLSGVQDSRRVVISVGNFSAADFFDDNAYSHDPRTQFLNWSLMANGAWDYPADARGYTNGIVSEWIEPAFALRVGFMM